MHRLRWIEMMGLMCVMGAASCTAPPASRGGFDSPDPASKLYAITRAGEQRDAAAIGHLIEQLDSDDQAVRMYSIVSLEKITGQRLGFVWYDPPHRRREAVARWAEAYRSGELATRPAEDSSATQP